MASNYWIKLYHEILDDPKMGRLRDNLWRRVIECFLIAGEMQGNGELPPLEDMAWRLRVNEEILESELGELAGVGILERRNGGWFVTNFADRQSAMSSSERGKRWREQQRKQDYYADETDDERDENENQTIRLQKRKEEETETDTEKELEPENTAAGGAAFRAYEDGFGQMLTPILSEKIGDAVDTYGEKWVVDAIEESVVHNARSWKYADAILRRWQVQGRNAARASPGANGKGDPKADFKRAIEEELRREGLA